MVNQSEQRPRRLQVWLPLLLSMVLVGGMLIGTKLKQAPIIVVEDSSNDQDKTLEGRNGRVEELIRYIEAKYVDKVDREKLMEEAINSLLKQLDPHSNYISAKHLQDVNEQLEGNFDGIGIEFMIMEDTILVVTPLAGGPSEEVGILAGDRIVEIEDSLIVGDKLTERTVADFLRGERGSKVTIGIRRGHEKDLRHFEITRAEIPLHSVDAGYMLDDKTGYIKVSRFSANTYREFMEKLENLVEKQGMQDLVIDLRQNPGGYLQEATNILSQLFREKDRLLVYTEGRTVKRSEYETTGKPFFEVGDIAVLIDEGSASASEILAGAVQDWDRGVIVGRRSFGKGLVQEQYNLRDGSALRLTVARYYTPSGRSIQKSYTDLDAYDKDLYDRYESGELLSEDSINVSDTTQFLTMKEKRVVYGGGGIKPDIFVSIDTSLFHDDYLKYREHLRSFVFRYVEDHQEELNYNLKEFKSLYSVPDMVITAFHDYLLEQGETELPKAMPPNTEASLKLLLKARMAKQLYGDEGFYVVWNSDDPVVKKALQALKQPNPLTYK